MNDHLTLGGGVNSDTIFYRKGYIDLKNEKKNYLTWSFSTNNVALI